MVARFHVFTCSAVALLLSACGTSTDSKVPVTVGGSVQGQPFAGKAGDFDVLQEGALLIAVSQISGGLCPLAEASDGGAAPSFDLQWLSIMTCGGTTEMTGEYAVTADSQQVGPMCQPKLAYAEIRRLVSGVASQVPADSGTLTLLSYSDQRLTGSLTLAFGGEVVAGEFSAGFCAALNH